MDSKILLENGTNELEILEFIVDGNYYGINVAKVKEIIGYLEPTPIPNSHPSIEGVFMPRDRMITAIDLMNCLQRGQMEKKGLFIITNFNKLDIAFHVEQVIGIHRVTWKDIITPNATLSDAESGVASGIVKISDRLIVILDFEKIVAEIAPETSIQIEEIDSLGPRSRNDQPIWVAEDSILLSKMIETSLRKAGYVNLRMFSNGRELWEALNGIPASRDLHEDVALIITDIEMPQMDGHRLTKLVKDNHRFNCIPLIIFSSLISEEMRIKGRQLGADEQLTKPEIGHLVDVMDHLLVKAAQAKAGK